MSAFVSVFILSVCMFFASMLFGIAPTVVTISERRTQTLGAFGAGLLVGTALGVILPEGINEIYNVHAFHKHLEKVDQHVDSVATALPTDVHKRHVVPNVDGVKHVQQVLNHDLESCFEYVHAVMEGKNKLIGTALVSGFLFMLLVNFVTDGSHEHGGGAEIDASARRHRGWIATVGLVVHSAADGIAMGAASFADSSVTMIVFLAVLLHKGPAAFGLSVYLLHNGLDAKKVRKHLLLFSSSAPVAALLTYFLVNQAQGDSSTEPPSHAIGILLLLSAGSFIFVATVHILPSVSLHQNSNASFVQKWLSLELLCLVLGAALPLLLHVEHSD